VNGRLHGWDGDNDLDSGHRQRSGVVDIHHRAAVSGRLLDNRVQHASLFLIETVLQPAGHDLFVVDSFVWFSDDAIVFWVL
jgi:hypothetical protein